jgi:NADPH-dependent 2,4-dienoyl-CoA reductase/sulfur reductase-like enzyme
VARVIVIGGNAAGMSAGSKILREGKNFEVSVFDSSNFVSYGACGMPYLFSREVEDVNKLFALSEEEILKRGIEIRKNELVTEILPGRKRIVLKNLKSGVVKEEIYDYLVITTGSKANRFELPDFEGKNVFCLHTLEDAIKLKDFIDLNNPYSATIIGLGYVAVEMAETLTKMGIKVNLLGRRNIFLKKLHPRLSAYLAEHLEENGVRIYTDCTIIEARKNGNILESIMTNRGEIKADFFLYAVGVHPATQFLKGSGISFELNDAIKVDERCRTNLHNIYSAGDCCCVREIITGKYKYIPLGTTANKMGRVAGANIAGLREEFVGVMGTSILRCFNYEIGMTGLTLNEALKEGIDAREVFIESIPKARYLKDDGRVFLNIIAEKGGRILGGQIMGTYGTKGRIDTLASLIYGKIKVKEAKYIDLSYAPPFSPVWDPLLTAFEKLEKMT